MTAFTDDLENDLEVLAEHHDVTQMHVAQVVLTLLPSHVRDALIRSLGIASLKSWEELTAPVNEESPGPIQEGTGLPQKLRGAVHELTHHYPANLVADAAMLALPEKVRHDVARAFLPKKPSHEKGYTVVDVASGEELGKLKDVHPHLRVLDGKTGEPVDYKHLRTVPEYDFREADDVEPRMLVLYRQVTAE